MTDDGDRSDAMFVGRTARSATVSASDDRVDESYYGRPILKEPTWTPEVPVYLFTGGVAGGCAVLMGSRALTRNETSPRALHVGAGWNRLTSS